MSHCSLDIRSHVALQTLKSLIRVAKDDNLHYNEMERMVEQSFWLADLFIVRDQKKYVVKGDEVFIIIDEEESNESS